MKSIRHQGKSYNFKRFYDWNSEPRLPDEKFYKNNEYNYMVALKLKSLGFTVTQELALPEWGIIDIFAYKMVSTLSGKQRPEIIIAECKSEKDRNMMRALGQILTYYNQLNEIEYNISKALIISRTEPARQRIRKDLNFLSYYKTEFKLIRFSNKTPNLEL